MMQPFNTAVFDAYERLLARPDAPDLPRRAHVYVCDGEPNRRATRFPALLRVWVQYHYLSIDAEELPASPASSIQPLATVVSIQKGLCHDAPSSPPLPARRGRDRLAHMRRLFRLHEQPLTLGLEE